MSGMEAYKSETNKKEKTMVSKNISGFRQSDVNMKKTPRFSAGMFIRNLNVEIAGKTVLQDIDLEVKPGEIQALMGPNGAGKTSLVMALAGHPNYKITNHKSQITMNNEDITREKPEERAKKGLFVAFQQPVEVNGVSVLSFFANCLQSPLSR